MERVRRIADKLYFGMGKWSLSPAKGRLRLNNITYSTLKMLDAVWINEWAPVSSELVRFRVSSAICSFQLTHYNAM